MDPTGEIALAIPVWIGGEALASWLFPAAVDSAVAAAIVTPGDTSPAAASGWVSDPQAQKEHDDYKNQYKQPPPPFKDPCDELRWKLQREKNLLNARNAWDAKWMPGRHAGMNGAVQSSNAIKKIEDKMKNMGCTCP